MCHAPCTRVKKFSLSKKIKAEKTETLLLIFISRMKIWKSKKVSMQKVELVQKALYIKSLENYGLWIAS